MQIQGTIKSIKPEQQVSASFKKRELVVVTNEQFPQSILIEFVQDKCDLLDNYAEGEEVIVSINILGREWVSPQGETKYFNSIKGYRIEKVESHHSNHPTNTAPANQAQPQEYQSPATDFNPDDDTDLPF
jgi:Domain of unknown function (DUF3127)